MINPGLMWYEVHSGAKWNCLLIREKLKYVLFCNMWLKFSMRLWLQPAYGTQSTPCCGDIPCTDEHIDICRYMKQVIFFKLIYHSMFDT